MTLKLFFLHIPKAGGTSFVKTLNEVYGEGQVSQFWDALHGNEARLKDNSNSFYHNHVEFRKNAREAMLKTSKSVLYGHIPIWALEDILPANTPIVTWLREPLDQTLSWLFYCLKRNVKGLRTTNPKDLIYEYTYRNMQFFYTGGCLDKFKFVGVLEHYDECLAKLACIMGWKNVTPHHLWPTEYYQSLREELKKDGDFCEVVRNLNCRDVALYQKAMEERIRGQIWR